MASLHEPGVLDRWHGRIGEVVVAAAYMESAVGTLAYALDHGATDRFYARMLNELTTHCEKRIPDVINPEHAAELQVVLEEVRDLAERRNDLIHGWWRFGIDGADALRGRASRRYPALGVSKISFDELGALLADLNTVRDRVLHLAAKISERRSAT